MDSCDILAGMVACDQFHREYDAIANKEVRVGELPEWTHVRGKVAWYAYAGPYRDLGEKGWQAFTAKVRAAKLSPRGPPGDLYVCDPEDHREPGQTKMLTLLWAPMRRPEKALNGLRG